ncbi:hypothetical protein [Candidatus Sulfurimonas baltica]|uniref:Uncharacterized protein n=1 Tax=Candidatus Sulfurimonas baltica TaxID=2740404 RepID=A0A7S7LSU9_9BACT|nr:hypothetical protein [Candidatus Sulfurimonas baltica]QOY50912.1 hypothetical protein HUE88_07085 [Candidatus Sulfurimonas baltica]
MVNLNSISFSITTEGGSFLKDLFGHINTLPLQLVSEDKDMQRYKYKLRITQLIKRNYEETCVDLLIEDVKNEGLDFFTLQILGNQVIFTFENVTKLPKLSKSDKVLPSEAYTYIKHLYGTIYADENIIFNKIKVIKSLSRFLDSHGLLGKSIIKELVLTCPIDSTIYSDMRLVSLTSLSSNLMGYRTLDADSSLIVSGTILDLEPKINNDVNYAELVSTKTTVDFKLYDCSCKITATAYNKLTSTEKDKVDISPIYTTQIGNRKPKISKPTYSMETSYAPHSSKKEYSCNIVFNNFTKNGVTYNLGNTKLLSEFISEELNLYLLLQKDIHAFYFEGKQTGEIDLHKDVNISNKLHTPLENLEHKLHQWF